MFKSGFVAVVGKPNAGKSSLINALVGFNIGIVTPKPQTTRFNIKGIRISDTSQIIFIDTPGVHIPKTKLGDYMIKGVLDATRNVDIIIYLVDATKPFVDEANLKIIKEIVATKKETILVINKIDEIKKENILRITEEYIKTFKDYNGNLNTIIPISVKKQDGLDIVINCIENLLKEGDMLYEEDEITDVVEKDLVAEYIREKALKYLNEEVPHGINVIVDKMKTRTTKENNTVYDIEATIICKKESHKPIIIGKNAEMLKKITNASKRDISKILYARVNLKIWVKVRKDWDNNEGFLSNIKDKIR